MSGPAEFQARVSQEALGLGELEGNGIERYIDDIALHSPTFEALLANLRKLFERLDQCDLRLPVRLNGQKCEFNLEEMDFLGHTVSAAGLGVRHQAKRTEAVLKMERPETGTQLRSFIGMCSYYHDATQGWVVEDNPPAN